MSIAEDYIPFARDLGRRAGLKWPHLREDIVGAALLGLVEAAATYMPETGVEFSTYARNRILGAIHDLKAGEIPLGFRWSRRESPAIRPLDTTPDPAYEAPVRADSGFEQLLNGLSGRHLDLLRWHYGEGMSVAAIARRMGMGRTYVHMIRRQALGKVCRRLEGSR